MVLKLRNPTLASVLILVLAGCASTGPDLAREDAPRRTQSVLSAPGDGLGQPDSAATDSSAFEPTVIAGNDRLFNAPDPRKPVIVRGDAVTLRFEQAPVTEVVHAILGDILSLPYVINQPVDGSLTIHTGGPLSRDKVLSVLEAVLQANGLAMVLDPAGVYHVGRPDSLRGVSPAVGSMGGALSPGQNLLIVPLQFVSAVEMADLLRPLATPETFVRIDSVRNLLILAGSRSKLDGLTEIVRTFDVDVLKGMSFGLFPLEHASASEIEAVLRSVVTGAAGAARPDARRGGVAGAEGAAGAGSQGGGQAVTNVEMFGPLAGVVRVLAIERLNALLVISPRAYYIEQAREWIAKLDQPRDVGNEPQLYVYPVQNGTASHLANLLNALFGTGTTATGTRQDSGVAPALGAGAGGAASRTRQQGTATQATAQAGSGAPSLSQVSLGPGVKVVADEFNNALLIHAPRTEYQKIETALRRLDISPTQVLIEASIMEVTLTDEFEFGLQWYFQGGVGGGRTGTGVFNPNSTGGIAPRQPGFSYSLTSGAGDVRAVLNTLAQKSLLNVISSPSVLVLDNHNAQIKVGDQQPVRSSTTVTDGGTQTSSIQYKDTGVMLSVTPSVNAGGLVTMVIDQSVTDVGNVDEATGQRSFLQRDITSRVAVRSGETVVLGGLIRDNTSRGRLGVPLLMDIPVLGHLFGTTTRNNNRTELIVLITPRVVRNDQDLRAVSEQMRERLSASMRTLPGWTGEGALYEQRPSALDVEVLPVRE